VFAPGTADQYSNIAFTVLTSVIEVASGRPYLDYLRSDVLQPMGIADVHVAATVHASGSGEVPGYDDPGIGLSWLQPRARVWEPNAYGGSFTLENGEGSGGLVTSASTIARVIATHAVWDVGVRQVAARYGVLDGTTSGAVSRGDGLDVGFVFNRRVSPSRHDGIRNAIDRFLNVHGDALR
jgi:CubicO group peptidase (beta-lactamase class C family)